MSTGTLTCTLFCCSKMRLIAFSASCGMKKAIMQVVHVCSLVPRSVWKNWTWERGYSYMLVVKVSAKMEFLLLLQYIQYILPHICTRSCKLYLRDVQDCHQRLSSAFDLLLFFLCSLIPTLTLTPPLNNALLAKKLA